MFLNRTVVPDSAPGCCRRPEAESQHRLSTEKGLKYQVPCTVYKAVAWYTFSFFGFCDPFDLPLSPTSVHFSQRLLSGLVYLITCKLLYKSVELRYRGLHLQRTAHPSERVGLPATRQLGARKLESRVYATMELRLLRRVCSVLQIQKHNCLMSGPHHANKDSSCCLGRCTWQTRAGLITYAYMLRVWV